MMDAKEKKILDAATQLFSEKGLNFTMQDLASSLHMSKKSIYKLYDNKEDLLIRLIECGYAEIRQMKQKIISSDLDISEKLRKEMIALPDEFKVVNWAQMSGLEKKYPRAAAKLAEELDRNWEPTFALLDEGVRIGRFRRVNHNVLKTVFSSSISHFLSDTRMKESGLTYEMALEEMMNILMDGINA